MKFTRSLPAKARARAKVPERIVMRMMFRCRRWKIHSMSAAAAQKQSSVSRTCSSTYSVTDAGMSPELFNPLKRAK